MVLIGTAVSAMAQNSTSPANEASASHADQQAVSGADQTSRILFTKNPDVNTADPDAGLDPVPPAAVSASASLTSELAENGPKYQPPAKVEAGTDLRTVDKPKNEIRRLPVEMMNRYVVKSSKVELLQGRDLYTPAELVSIEFREHPGLRVGNFFGLNSGAAYESFLAEERLEKMDDLKDTAMAIAAGGDTADARAILDATAQAYMRTESNDGPVGIK